MSMVLPLAKPVKSIPMEERAEALFLVKAYWHNMNLYRSATMMYENPPIFLHREQLTGIVVEAKNYIEKTKTAIASFLDEESKKHNYVRFYRLLHNSPAVLVFIAAPPDATWEKNVDPWYYIRYYFFTHKDHKPLLAKFFMFFTRNYYQTFMRMKEKHPLWNYFKVEETSYIKKGYKETRARRLAYRKMFRVIIGMAYLIRVIDALEAGLEPSPRMIPSFLKHHPELAETLLTPGEIFGPPWTKYTWKRLLAMVQQDYNP